jgi:hypothetical protein
VCRPRGHREEDGGGCPENHFLSSYRLRPEGLAMVPPRRPLVADKTSRAKESRGEAEDCRPSPTPLEIFALEICGKAIERRALLARPYGP